jgi:MarR family transcriptional regulator, organic hydroperoxide resistance regulator
MSGQDVSARRVDIAQSIWQAEHALTAHVQRSLRRGLTIEQWRVLVLLSDAEGHRMSEIASFAMVPPPTLTKIIDRMVENNLVYRRVDSLDRRRVLVFLTARGREAYRLSASNVALGQRELIDALGTADAAQLADLLNQLAQAAASLPRPVTANRGRGAAETPSDVANV